MEIKDVEKLAELAKIELTEEEKRTLLKDMDSILDYVKQISEVDLPVMPAYTGQAGVSEIEYTNKNIWREDMLESRDFSHDLVVEQFPDEKDGFVKVKKIL